MTVGRPIVAAVVVGAGFRVKQNAVMMAACLANAFAIVVEGSGHAPNVCGAGIALDQVPMSW